MKKQSNLILCLIILTTLSIQVIAGNDKAGTTAAQFLGIGVGARAIGMGEAFGAIADDISAIYWNPAGLTSVNNIETSFTYTQWFQQVNYGFLGYVQQIKGLGVIGISGNYLTYGDIAGTSEDLSTGAYLPSQDTTFTALDSSIVLSYAREITDRLSIGLNGKTIQQKIETENANGSAGDIGMQYILSPNKSSIIPNRIALSIHNLGQEITFINESAPIPSYVRFGIAYHSSNKNTNLGIDLNIPTDSEPGLNIGIEHKLSGIFILRGGYKSNKSALGVLAGLSAGVGFVFNNYYIDYAFVPYGDLGDTHRVSLNIKFSESEKKVKSKRSIKAKKETKIIKQSVSKLNSILIHGKVTDIHKKPLSKTIIGVVKDKKIVLKTSTDDKGLYEIRNLKEDIYKLAVSRKGYKLVIRNVKIISNMKKPLKLNFKLQEKQKLKKARKIPTETERTFKAKKVTTGKGSIVAKENAVLTEEEKKAKMRKYFLQATEYYKAVEYKKAIAEWKEVLKLDPNHELSKQKIEKAKNRLNGIVTEEEKKTEMKKHFAQATGYFKVGGYQKAITEWEKVLEFNPNHELSKLKIEKARQKLNGLVFLTE